jgi:hypothetical protein
MHRRIMKLRSTAMWNLTGDDLRRAKEELKGRRAALQAHYDSEVSRLDVELTDIERVERFAVNFTSNYKDDAPWTRAVDPALAAREAAPPEAASEHTPVEQSTDAAAALSEEKSPSRWRMRLSAEEASP